MKIKKLYLLFIFISSLLLTNLYYSNTKPPLFDHTKNTNIVLVTDNHFHQHELITTTITTDNHFILHGNLVYDTFICTLATILISIYICHLKNKTQYFKDIFDYYGILFRYKKRVLRI